MPITFDNVYAGIILYNPDINRLLQNICSIYMQVHKVIIIDNCSENISDIEKKITQYKNIVLIKNKKNLGIASALNQIFEYANKDEIEWVYTLDQDSISDDNIINMLLKSNTNDDIGIICPNVYEDNLRTELTCYDTKKFSNKKEPFQISRAITSGALTRVSAWKKIGMFNDKLFIDYVDFDFSIRLLIHNYKIIRDPNVKIYHELGNCEYKKIFGKKIRISHHSKIRKYYMGRNIVFYIKSYYKYINVLIEILRLIKIPIFIIFFEKDKKNKLRFLFNGIRDGMHLSNG